ncbi:CHAT domain-containing protein [Nocardiopsis sp. NPDC006139]|uniref:CHAT domain-containing protein n=1 Tax=Nocardiopsis sp. NPDC006139 TaxID=3154578 RepID=UPI0033B59449
MSRIPVEAPLEELERLCGEDHSPLDCVQVAQDCIAGVQGGAPLDVAERVAELLAARRKRLSEDDEGRVSLYYVEANAWRVRYLHAGREHDLRRAIEAIDGAFAAAGPDHSMYSQIRADRAIIHVLRPGTDVIGELRATVQDPDIDSRTRARVMLNLVNELQQRYIATQDSTALDEAVDLADQALELDSRTDDDKYWWRLMRAGQAHVFKGAHNRDAASFDQGIALHLRSVARLRPGHPYWPGALNQFASALHGRALMTGSGDSQRRELALAVHLLRTSVHMADPAAPDYPTFAENLATALRGLWRVTGEQSLLDEAITVMERGRASSEASPTARERDSLAMVTAMLRIARDPRDPEFPDLLAEGLSNAHPHSAVLGGLLGAYLETEAEDWQGAADLLRHVVERLPHAISEAIPLEDRERGLATIATDLARDAGAVFLRAGRPVGEALQILESGRALLIGQALARHRNADLDPVRAMSPPLAARVEELRAELARVQDAGHGPNADRRHRLVGELREVTEQIRSLPGLDRYLLPPAPGELARRVGAVPVATVNVSRFRCDALILREGGGTQLVPLPDLTQEEAARRAEEFTAAVTVLSRPLQQGGPTLKERLHHGAVLVEVLSWLWETVAEPVLAALGITSVPGTGTLPPHLRWSPTGPLTLLPLHAAERPGTPGDSVMARVVSSYIPTLRLLDDPRAEAAPSPPREGYLVVPVPHSSLMPEEPLEQAGEEAAHLGAVLPQARSLEPEGVSAPVVQAGLGGARGVHFAGHGISDAHHPSRSHLVLRDEILTVADLIAQRLDGLGLAFLSACHTAHAGARLPDEILHLTSAFRAAGARNAVGALWKTGDEHARRFTEVFYERLGSPVDGDTGGPDPERVAAAVHHAAVRVREEYESPMAWAPFVHVG